MYDLYALVVSNSNVHYHCDSCGISYESDGIKQNIYLLQIGDLVVLVGLGKVTNKIFKQFAGLLISFFEIICSNYWVSTCPSAPFWQSYWRNCEIFGQSERSHIRITVAATNVSGLLDYWFWETKSTNNLYNFFFILNRVY